MTRRRPPEQRAQELLLTLQALTGVARTRHLRGADHAHVAAHLEAAIHRGWTEADITTALTCAPITGNRRDVFAALTYRITTRLTGPPPHHTRPWCTQCDTPVTRLFDLGDHVIRCPYCHPAGRLLAGPSGRCLERVTRQRRVTSRVRATSGRGTRRAE